MILAAEINILLRFCCLIRQKSSYFSFRQPNYLLIFVFYPRGESVLREWDYSAFHYSLDQKKPSYYCVLIIRSILYYNLLPMYITSILRMNTWIPRLSTSILKRLICPSPLTLSTNQKKSKKWSSRETKNRKSNNASSQTKISYNITTKWTFINHGFFLFQHQMCSNRPMPSFSFSVIFYRFMLNKSQNTTSLTWNIHLSWNVSKRTFVLFGLPIWHKIRIPVKNRMVWLMKWFRKI